MKFMLFRDAIEVTRRRVLLGGAASLIAAAPRQASAQASGPPTFFTARGQFVTLDPQVDVSHVDLRKFDGSARSIRSYRGKALLLSFWASWCPPCRRELPILAVLQARAPSEPFDVAPVSVDRDSATAAAYLSQLKIPRSASFFDPSGLLAASPGTSPPSPFPLIGLPMSYVVDPRGSLVGYVAGEADWSSDDGLGLLRYYGRA